ncbi:MAG TPA: MG2 domain-containing protein, partial [Chitinophagaceae bacterium]|nr:MG2 domain-containing protein [Chitinophagaceae bacterium]
MNYLRAIWSALLCFLALPLFAQQTPYDPAWKKIDSLIAKGLPRSAEAEAAQIYTRAKKEGAEAQMLKALLYRISLQEETREGQEEKALRELEAEARSATGAVRALLQSYMADLYWNYLNRHRWQLRQRTATDSAGGDFATWSTSDFHQKISALFLQSLEPKALLQRTRLEPFDPLIIRGNLRHLRPTLFDLLAHRALPYFKSGDRDLQRPAYAFEITGPEAFLPAAAFARAAFVTKDSLSLQQKALLLYQELIRLHLDDPQKDALIDADLQRLQYVYSESRAAEKPEWYRAALEEAMAGYGRHPEALQAHYLLALTYEQQAAAYQPLGDTTHRWARIKAKEILEPVVRDSSTAAIKNAAGWANAYNLLQELNSTSFSFELEGVNLPGQPFRALVRYRNNSRLFFRLVKAGPAQLEAPEGPGSEAWWKALLAEPVLRNWEQALPPAGDLQEHSVEIKIDALPQGAYYLLASEDASFRPGRGLVGTQAFHVSNIAYVQKDDLIFLLHRRTGQPLSGATAQVIHRTYDYERRRFHRQAGPTFSADKNGRVQINRGAAGRLANQPYLLDLRHGEDRLFQHHNQFYYHPDYPAPQEAPDRHQSFFYTDRSLYRPGQLLHFKGLVVGGKARDIRPLNGRQLTIFLTDANGEKVDSVAVTTNE